MHTFELASLKVSICLRFPNAEKGFAGRVCILSAYPGDCQTN